MKGAVISPGFAVYSFVSASHARTQFGNWAGGAGAGAGFGATAWGMTGVAGAGGGAGTGGAVGADTAGLVGRTKPAGRLVVGFGGMGGGGGVHRAFAPGTGGEMRDVSWAFSKCSAPRPRITVTIHTMRAKFMKRKPKPVLRG